MNKLNKIILWIIGLIIVIGLIWLGYSDREVVREEGEVIKIGVTIPISGGAKSYGQSVRWAVDLALEEINKEGEKIKLIYEDTQADIKTGLNAIQKLISQDKVDAIIGDPISGISLAMAPIIEENKIVMIAPGSAVPELTKAGKYIFRLKLGADVDSSEMARISYNNLGFRNVDLIYINNDYGVGVKESFTDEFNKLGGNVVREESFFEKTTDFRTLLTKIKNDDVDLIVIASFAQELGIFLKQKLELGIEIPVFTHRGGVNPEMMRIAEESSNGLIFLEEFDIDDPREEVQEFVKNFENKYNEKPELFAAMGFDALNIFSEAFDECSVNSECVKNYLFNLKDYKGVSGIINFDEFGNVLKETAIKMILNGKFIPYQPQ